MVDGYTLIDRLINLRLNNVERRMQNRAKPTRRSSLRLSDSLNKKPLGKLVNKSFGLLSRGVAFLEYPLLKGTKTVNLAFKEQAKNGKLAQAVTDVGVTAVKHGTGIDQVEKAGRIAMIASSLYPYVSRIVTNTSGLLHNFGKRLKNMREKDRLRKNAEQNNKPRPNRFSNENNPNGQQDFYTEPTQNNSINSNSTEYPNDSTNPSNSDEDFNSDNSNLNSESDDSLNSTTADSDLDSYDDEPEEFVSENVSLDSANIITNKPKTQIHINDVDSKIYTELIQQAQYEREDFTNIEPSKESVQAILNHDFSNAVEIQIEKLPDNSNKNKLLEISKINSENNSKLNELKKLLN